jgi:hypothetical protein
MALLQCRWRHRPFEIVSKYLEADKPKVIKYKTVDIPLIVANPSRGEYFGRNSRAAIVDPWFVFVVASRLVGTKKHNSVLAECCTRPVAVLLSLVLPRTLERWFNNVVVAVIERCIVTSSFSCSMRRRYL